MKANKLTAFIALLSLAGTAMGATYYVNPSTDPVTGGNDDWDGTCEVWEGGESLHGPKQTLVGVMEVATTSGDVVIALPGVYSNRLCGCEKDYPDQYARVSVPAGVTLKSKYGAKHTIILGRTADNPVEGKYGCGTGYPARCVVLGDNSWLEGFTLTGGRTYCADASSNPLNGGAMTGYSSAAIAYCIISNNVARRSAVCTAGRFYGCVFMYNRALDGNGNVSYGTPQLFNCFIDCNPTKEAPAGYEFYVSKQFDVWNCTFGSHLNALVYTGTSSTGGINFHNCIDMCPKGGKNGVYYNSAYVKLGTNATADGQSFKTTAASLAVNDDGTLMAGSAAINCGDTAAYNSSGFAARFSGYKDSDMYAFTRVVGSSIDLGCCEYDPDARNWYVDPVGGCDWNSGRSAEKAFRTLAVAATDELLRSGDILNAAPGVYDEGVNDEDISVRSRVHLPAGVTLMSTAGAEQTIIKGAASTHEYATEYGNGTNAVRCVRMEANAKVVGFTLTGGHTALDNGYNRGGAAFAGGNSYLVDCVVSNNISCVRGVIVANVNSIRCRYIDNSTEDIDPILYYGPADFFDCYFAGNKSYSTDQYAIYGGAGERIRLFNCTFMDDGNQTSVRGGVVCYNCLFLGRTPGSTGENAVSKFYSCALASRPFNTAYPSVIDENSMITNAENLAVYADGRLKRRSLCVDAGSNLCYTAAYPFQVDEYIDLCRTNRIWNGRIDIGCCEFIPPPPSGLSVLIK